MLFKKLFKGTKGKKLDQTFIDKIIGNMVQIPAGSFLMGSNEGEDDERPIHNVLIDSFDLCKYEVTQKEWFDVMGTRPWEGLKYLVVSDNCPAVNISWYDAREFIRELNEVSEKQFRMPAEAEWEYACRAGASNAFAHGVLRFNLAKYAWFYDNAFKKDEMYAHEVATRSPNKWGLFDMQGNIYEWCSDWYRRNYYNKS
ncbi:MAG: formylglycine-generating enzyme family protein, partial [bacterium]|nr:formylglycine-generating enzyme family protein [bacterium]